MSVKVQSGKAPSKMMAGAFAALTIALAGCAGGYGAGDRSPAGVGEAAPVYYGTVENVREVQIRPDRSIVGAATGAVLGGIAGSEIGQGDKAETAGAIGGAVIGGVAGNEAGKALNTRKGYAYVVRFQNGDLKEIVQGADTYIAPGTPVSIIYSNDGWKLYPQAQQAPAYGTPGTPVNRY